VPEIRIGISGWTYPPWRGVFYPRGLAHRKELAYAAEHLSSIEVNGSFYALQRPETYQSWREQTPTGFVFSVKAGRFITHLKKLRDIEVPTATFLASGVLALADKLGPILWQLPPNLGFDADRMERFFALLPTSTAEAAAMAAGHDTRIEGRAFTTTDADRPLRHAVEVRHETFNRAQFLDLARRHGVAVVTADTAGRWPVIEEATAGFRYVRLHGDEELYVSGYDDAALDRWADRLRRWSSSGDVFVYFDNDAKARAPVDAMALMDRLGVRASGGG
jgi:uncharacterized protein YecE (DUF72 family)